ncbi:hypothetical protein OC845_006550 [Tilletia horrida]|nr:hypothetical protein OC845_006550 [Tilletia horrida]
MSATADSHALQSLLDQTIARLQRLDMSQSADVVSAWKATWELLGSLDATLQCAIDGQNAEDGEICEEDGMSDDRVFELTRLPQYVPKAILADYSFLTKGYSLWDCRITHTLGPQFPKLAHMLRTPYKTSLKEMFEVRQGLLAQAETLRIPRYSSDPVRNFFIWMGGPQVPAESDLRPIMKLHEVAAPEKEPAPFALIVGTFATAQGSILQRDDADLQEPALTGEIAHAWFRHKEYAKRVGFVDANFFAHCRANKEPWSTSDSRAMFKLGWQVIQASGARVVILTAGSNRERWAFWFFRTLAFNTSSAFGVMSALVKNDVGEQVLVVFVEYELARADVDRQGWTLRLALVEKQFHIPYREPATLRTPQGHTLPKRHLPESRVMQKMDQDYANAVAEKDKIKAQYDLAASENQSVQEQLEQNSAVLARKEEEARTATAEVERLRKLNSNLQSDLDEALERRKEAEEQRRSYQRNGQTLIT